MMYQRAQCCFWSSCMPMVSVTMVLLFALPAAAQNGAFGRLRNTPHNLSVSGPGSRRAAQETETCIFCHTPHGAEHKVVLWNRELSTVSYRIYESSTLKARPGQPTGSSKLCLSCHDGTIALGRVGNRGKTISMQGTSDRLQGGRSSLGTDLSDDHPISFQYASSFAGGDTHLLPRTAIVPPVRLDKNGEVQCTSCHLVHDNSLGNFLIRSDANGELCLSCHEFPAWTSSSHATSGEQVPSNVAVSLGADRSTVASNSCKSCHRSHGAPGRWWLLHSDNISDMCLECHDGRVAGMDVRSEIRKPSHHGMDPDAPGTFTEGLYFEGDRISCADCHDSHAAGSEGTGAVSSSLTNVSGVSMEGVQVPNVRADHELCFRCHGSAPVRVGFRIDRITLELDKRLQFQPNNPSFHPIDNPGKNLDVPSLVPPLDTASKITCGDCHDSDTSRKFGGTGAAGPHGSDFWPLLALRYDTTDFSAESPEAYALCYRCHQRTSILSDDSFPSHRKHIDEELTPCSVCHDAHGISAAQGNSTNHSHLMNFDRSVVFPSGSGRLEFVDQGRYKGECYLTCHGSDHDPKNYGF